MLRERDRDGRSRRADRGAAAGTGGCGGGAEMRFYVLRLLQKPFSAGVVLSAEASEPHTVIFGFSAHSSRRHAYFASGGRFCSVPTTCGRVKEAAVHAEAELSGVMEEKPHLQGRNARFLHRLIAVSYVFLRSFGKE